MTRWESGVSVGFTVADKDQAEWALVEGLARHMEKFDRHANTVKVGPGFPWPEVLGDMVKVDDSIGHDRLMLFCYVPMDGEEDPTITVTEPKGYEQLDLC